MHIAIEAMSRLVAHMPDAQLTIVGNGPEETRLKSEIAATERRREHHIRVVDAAAEVSSSLRHAMTFSSSPVCTTVRGGWFSNPSARDCRSLASISADRGKSSRRRPGSSSIRRDSIHPALRHGWPKSCVCFLLIQNGLPPYRPALSLERATFFCAIR